MSLLSSVALLPDCGGSIGATSLTLCGCFVALVGGGWVEAVWEACSLQ